MRAIAEKTGQLADMVRWSLLSALKHDKGAALAVVYGADVMGRLPSGSIVAFNYLRADGSVVGFAEVCQPLGRAVLRIRCITYCQLGSKVGGSLRRGPTRRLHVQSRSL